MVRQKNDQYWPRSPRTWGLRGGALQVEGFDWRGGAERKHVVEHAVAELAVVAAADPQDFVLAVAHAGVGSAAADLDDVGQLLGCDGRRHVIGETVVKDAVTQLAVF